MRDSRAFVLDKDKADEFLRQKADAKLIERIYRNADKFEKNNIKANKEYEKGYTDGYNKAIDDFAEKIADWCDFCNGGMRDECVKDDKCKIYEMAEELKSQTKI